MHQKMDKQSSSVPTSATAMTNKPKPQQPSPASAPMSAADIATYILANWAFKYVHPDHFCGGRNPQEIIDEAIRNTASKVEAFASHQLQQATAGRKCEKN